MADAGQSFTALKAISAKPALFPAAADEARKAVNLIVRAQLAAEGTDLATLKKIRGALEASVFAEALDGVPAAKIKTLAARLDPHAHASSDQQARIRHLLALADGTIQPAKAPAQAPVRASGRTRRGAAAEPAPAPAAVPDSAPKEPKRRKIIGRTALRTSEGR